MTDLLEQDDRIRKVEGLDLPKDLCRLISDGHWPQSASESNCQHRANPPIPRDLVERLAPGERNIYLYPPPFRTVASCCEHGERDFWEKSGTLSELVPSKAILIGDFGLGSDAPIVLDYRAPGPPSVLRLQWGEHPEQNHWVPFFANFGDFARSFKLFDTEWRSAG